MSTAGTVAALILIGGVGIGLAALFPPYYAGGSSLSSTTANLLYNTIRFAGWAVAALLIALRRTGVGTWLAVGVTAASLGYYGTNTGYVARYGAHVAGTGFWLGQASWVVCAAGTLAGIAAARYSGVFGAPRRTQPAFPLLVAVGAIAAAVAYSPGWTHYHLFAATTGRHEDITLGNAFHNPGWVIAANVIILTVLVVGPVVVMTLRPSALAAAALAGLMIPQIANLASEIVVATSPADPRMLGGTSQQLTRLHETLTVNPTAWFWFEAIAIGALSLLCLARVLITDPEDTVASPPRRRRRTKVAPSWHAE